MMQIKDVVVFYADAVQRRLWDRELLANLPDDAARSRLLAADPDEWRTKPGWYWHGVAVCHDG
jgi:hypothetical protein